MQPYWKNKTLIIITLWIFLFIQLLPAAGLASSDSLLKKLSSKELNQLEMQADQGRELFYQGNYQEAASIFKKLSQDLTVSKPLYLNELGSCYLAMGDYKSAKSTFLKSAQLLEVFYDENSESDAVGYFGSENKKIYKGDPYERASLSLLLGLLFMHENDFDNSLACIKNGLLADSDVANELYKSDFTILHILESFILKTRQDNDGQKDCQKLARDAYAASHPYTRRLISKQMKMTEAFESETKQEEKNKKQKELEELNISIENTIANLNMDYINPLLDNQYNTLLVVWSGKAPSKKRVGQYGEKDIMLLNPSYTNRYEITLTDNSAMDAIQGLCDISYQATTRGGREMDNVLRNQAEFKAFTSQFGDSFIDAADDVGGYAGLAMIAIGLIAKGVSAATTPEADIRHWATLPDSLQILPLNLPEGNYTAKIEGFNDYIKMNENQKHFTVDGNKEVNIVFSFFPILKFPQKKAKQVAQAN